MIARFIILRSALFVGALFFIVANSFAQNGLELLPGSERAYKDKKTGHMVLVGSATFKYQGNIMFCDSARFDLKRSKVWAYGNVHINKRDTLNLYCDSLRYDGKTKKAKLKGNVRVRDQEYKLTTNELDYDADKGQASYYTGGRVEGSKTREVLTSQIGYYYPESKNFSFAKNVVYQGQDMKMTTDTLQYRAYQQRAYFYGPTDIQAKNATMYCESGWYQTDTEEGKLSGNAWISRDSSYISGDTLIYLAQSGTYEGIGDVYYMDSTENLVFTGDYAFASDSSHYTLLTGKAIASKMMENDTLHIHADTLYNYKKDTINVLRAYHGAKTYSRNFQSQSDSLVYDKSKEKVELHESPIVWSNETELKGTYMEMFVRDSIIDSVNIYNKGTILMEIEPKLYYNQVHGNDIKAVFKNNEMHRAFVYGNAMTIAYPEEDEKTDSTLVKHRKGMNRLYSSDIRVDFDSSEIIGIAYLKQPDGAFYPMTQIAKHEQFVPGFIWKGFLRPMNKEALLIDMDTITPEEQIGPESQAPDDNTEETVESN
ncbi:MAG: OstA-like protein [Crocinitomicaceae bacterium]